MKPIVYHFFVCGRFIVSLLFFSAFFGGCTSKNKEIHTPSMVVLRTIQKEEVSDSLLYPARLQSKIHAELLSEHNGFVTNILVSLGKEVREKDPLMILKHSDPIYQYAPIKLLSPITGVVSHIEVSAGSRIQLGQKLISIVNVTEVELEIEIPAEDLPLMHVGMKGVFKKNQKDSHSTPVEVFAISPWVDPRTGTAKGKLHWNTKEKPIISLGMQGQVRFQVNTHSSILIPETSIFYKNKQVWVRILEEEEGTNGKAKHIPVQIGKNKNEYIEILSGLEPGMNLIERSNRFIADGERIDSIQK